MSVNRAIKRHVLSTKAGAVFTNSDFDRFGAPTAVEPALSRLVKAGTLCRVRNGLYFRTAKSRFGIGGADPMTLALKVAGDRAAGPAGAAAANLLGLSTQMPATPEIALVGRPPANISGIKFRERSNVYRITAKLRPKEIALIEIAREGLADVEVSEPELMGRVRALEQSGQINIARISKALAGESRAVRNCVTRLISA